MSRLSKKWALALVSSLLTLLLLELAIRIYGFDLDIEPAMRFHPTLGWTMDPQNIGIDSVNPDGFRYPPVTREKPPGERRALVLGDSFAAGTSFPYDFTLPGQLREALRRTGENWQVVSLAAGDWGNAQQLVALREYGLDFQPDVVVLQIFPFNDLCNDAVELADTCSLRDYLRPYAVARPTGVELTFLSPWKSFLRRRSLLFGFIENKLLWAVRRRQGLDPDDPRTQGDYFEANSERIGVSYGGALASLLPEEGQSQPVQAAWKTMGVILGEFHRELGARSIPMVGLVIPYARTLPPMWEDYGRHRPGLQPHHGTARAEGLLGELGIPFVSLRARILDGPWQSADCFLLPRDSHLNAFGASMAAGWIVDEMRRLGLVKSSGDPNGELWDALDPSRRQPAFQNFTGVESRGDQKLFYGYGPDGRVAFFSPRAGRAHLEMEMTAQAPALQVQFQNGPRDHGKACVFAAAGESQSAAFDWPVSEGRNEILITYSNWLGKDQSEFSRRPLAVRFEKFQITLQPPAVQAKQVGNDG